MTEDAKEAARRYLAADPRGAHLTKGEINSICRALLSTPNPAVVERLRGALQECVWAMKADNPAEGWKDAIDEGEAALAQAGQPQEGGQDGGLESAAQWHDQRARDTPDAFETEFHQVSAKTIRALKSTPPSGAAGGGGR